MLTCALALNLSVSSFGINVQAASDSGGVEKGNIVQLTGAETSAHQKVDAIKEKFDGEFGSLRPVCGQDSNIVTFVTERIQNYSDCDTEGVTVVLNTTDNTDYIEESGDIHYKKDELNTWGNNTTNVACTFTFHCDDASAVTESRNVTVGWDTEYVNGKIQEEANQLTKEMIQTDNGGIDLSAVTQDFTLRQCMGTSVRQVWSVIDWSSSDTEVISLEETGYGSRTDPKKAVVHPREKDTEVTLTAEFKVNDSILNNYVDSVSNFTTVKKTFTITVKGSGQTAPSEEELLTILNTYYTEESLKEFGSDKPVDFENCQTDIQLLRYTRVEDTEGNQVFKNKEITVTSDKEKVISINGYRASVDIFQDEPVTVNLIITFTRDGVSVKKEIPVKVGVITDEMLSQELAMMNKAKEHYFDGINDGQYEDKDSVTGDLHAFQEMTLDDDGNPVWIYNADEKTGQGIVPDSMFEDPWEMEGQGYNLFKSSNNAVVQHENLRVTRRESDEKITISSLLSSERYGKFAKAHPENEKLQQLYKQPVEVTVTIKGTVVSDRDALEEKIAELKEKLDQIQEGSGEGQYTEGTRAILQTAIEKAAAVLEKAGASDAEYNDARQWLIEAEKQVNDRQNVISAEISIASVRDTTVGVPDCTIQQSVRADEAKKVGYTKPEGMENQVTVLDALVVLHRQMFGTGEFDAAPQEYLSVSENGIIHRIFGMDTANLAFYVNDKMPSTYCNESVLHSGDRVCVMLYKDTEGFSDKYLYIILPDQETKAGESFSLTIKNAGYPEDELAAGCEVTVTDPDGKTRTALTDENGIAAFKAEKAGTYTAQITKAPFTYWATGGKVSLLVTGDNPEVPETPSEKPAAHQHSFGEFRIVKEATVFEEGLKERSCVCGYKERAAIARLTPSMTVNTAKLPLQVKQKTKNLTVTGLAEGDYVKSWQSGNKKIFKVKGNANGTCKIIAGKKQGKATLTITLASGLTKKVKVTVQKGIVRTKKITGISRKLIMQKGTKLKLKPVFSPVTTQQKCTYISSNKKTAIVNKKGRLKALKKGKSMLTIKSGKAVIKCKIIVK